MRDDEGRRVEMGHRGGAVYAALDGQFELLLMRVHEGGEADADEAEGGGDEAVAGEENAGEAVDVAV